MAKFQCSTFSSQLEIDLDALRGNYRALSEEVSPAECAAVVKADAYGLGARSVALALYREGCRAFFVAQLCEALDLHASLPLNCTLFILNGLDPGSEKICAGWGFVPVLSSHDQVGRWRSEARSGGRRLPCALQVETGMSRLGLSDTDFRDLADDASLVRDVDMRLLITHLACADDPDAVANPGQRERFQALTALFPGVPRSIANSCGIALSSSFHYELVRPGIALYGVPPRSKCLGISPVVGLKARVLQVRELETGTGVGYGLTYTAPGPRRLATVAIGYADGWPRSLSNVGAAWHRDVRLPIVGRISMDSMTVDISETRPDAVREGDFVDLIGPRQSVEDVASDAGTIPYEILTRLGARHARAYAEGGTTTISMPGDPR